MSMGMARFETGSTSLSLVSLSLRSRRGREEPDA
jgi:hypothetical protein